MGSLVNQINKSAKKFSQGYSKRKQANWHYVGEGTNRPMPYKLDLPELVISSRYAHIDKNNFIIP